MEARIKVGGPHPLTAEASIRLDQPEDGGFFKDVKYGDIDQKAPSVFADGTIVTVPPRVTALEPGVSSF